VTLVSLTVFLVAAMSHLAPGRDHRDVAVRMASVIAEERPLFHDDADRIRTASLVCAVAWRESSFRVDAIGDEGRAFGLYQLWHAPRQVLSDVELATRLAMQRLRESMRIGGSENPLGLYAAGPRHWDSPKARRISADRLHIAKRLAKAAEVSP